MATIDTISRNDRNILSLSEAGIKNILALGHYNYRKAKEDLDTHIHSGIIEICYLAKGRQVYRINDEVYTLDGGDVIIIYPDEPHGTNKHPEEKGSLFWMLIKLPEKNEGILNLNCRDSMLLINKVTNLRPRRFNGCKDMSRVLLDIFRNFDKASDPFKMIELNSNILSFLLKVIECGKKNDSREVSAEIEFICKHIHEHIFEAFSLESLACMINLSLSRFKHRFKEEIGIPPKEYILREKISKAKEIIQKTNNSFTNIAYELGFSSCSYFSTVFRRFTRSSPTEFKIHFLNNI